MLPLLVYLGDGAEHSLAEVIEVLGDRMGLSPEDKKELLPSESDVKFDNRVRWAAFYLRKAELVERTGRGRIRITERGRQVLGTKPERINIRFLRQFPEFLEFQQGTRRTESEDGVGTTEEAQATPEETLEASYLNLRRTLAQELLDRVKKCPPKFFEKLVVDLLVSMGYGGSRKDAGQAIGQRGDDGIDGIIKEDKLVAVAGERMKMNEFTEVSAVVTHPSCEGNVFEKQLVANKVNKIFAKNKTPYLHVAESNLAAIRLYEKLGFRTRRRISFWNLENSSHDI